MASCPAAAPGAGQVRDPLVVLLAAAVLTAATSDWTDTPVIILVIFVNMSVGCGG